MQLWSSMLDGLVLEVMTLGFEDLLDELLCSLYVFWTPLGFDAVVLVCRQQKHDVPASGIAS